MLIDRARPDKFGMEQWSINGEIYQDGRPAHRLKPGRHYRLVLKNQTEEAHPLHLHRSRFQLSHVNGIPTGGILKDVVVLKGYQDTATFAKPAAYPTGIDAVLVNGTIAVDHEKSTGEMAGEVLFHTSFMQQKAAQ